METTSLNMTLFIVTALVAIALAIWQINRAKKAKSERETSAMDEPVQHQGKYDDDGSDKYDAPSESKYEPSQKHEYKAAQ